MALRKNRLVQLGDRISDAMSRLFAHAGMQIGVIVFCAAWFWFGFHAEGLTAALSILAITLTQMVLNGQYDREAEAHRRDVAMHAKLDELIKATKRARDEMVGIEEELEEEEIRELREEAKDLVERAAKRSGEHDDGENAKRAIERVGDGK
ncbi:hypothetical protein GCM10022280_26220 [Sphingomonas swuensis]|uniref:Low affinity iron permease family protein n=1 Tax=Sphingomonas swuensis TaxID=977800 RepID=A0ABP7TC83_9SPHN